MLLRIIESIRQKPKVVRKQLAFVVTIAFTAVVAGVWTLSLPAQLATLQSDTFSAVPVENQTASMPFSSMWQQLKGQVTDLANTATSPAPEDATDAPEVLVPAPSASQSIQLESGSTITFGTSTPETIAPVILLGTSSANTSTSPLRD